MTTLKIGDKVRFLNQIGGGIISGFQSSQVCLVKDEDGFEIPTLVKEVVLVDEGRRAAAPKPKRSAVGATDAEEPDLADLPMTYRPKPLSRRGADALNVSLAFVPHDPDEPGRTEFEAWLVNDCNFFVRYALLSPDAGGVRLRFEGELEPHTKILLEEFPSARLETWEHVTFQLFAFKRDESFRLPPVCQVPLKIRPVRFFQPHTFLDTPFFHAPAWLVPVVKEPVEKA